MTESEIQPEKSEPAAPLVLLTGATGYVGSRLLRRLQERPVRLRCLARTPGKLRPQVAEATEVVEGDVLDRRSLDRALASVTTAYYLVHLMASSADFEQRRPDSRRELRGGCQDRWCQADRLPGGVR